MRIFTKAVVSTTAVGLLAFGAVVGSTGSALAAPSPNALITGCTADTGTIAVGVQPNCLAIGGTVDNPTSVIIDVDTDQLGTLIADQTGQGLNASWVLSCVVNGATVSVPGTYDVTSTTQSPYTVINLQTTVGSPEPTQCTVEDLTVHTALALNASDADVLTSPFTAGVVALANTAVPGAIYQQEGTTSGGAHAVLCADDTANGNAGSKIQSFQCLSDLADSFVQTSVGQLVHNGDCLSVSGSNVVLARCAASATDQEWSQSAVGGELRIKSTGRCLTAPSAKDGVQLTVRACTGKSNQKWHIPARSASVSSTVHYSFRR